MIRFRIYVCCLMAFFVFACQSDSNDESTNTSKLSEKELELKQKELDLKERELRLKEDQSDLSDTGTNGGLAKNEEELVLDIRAKFADINNNIKSYEISKIDFYGRSSEGGELTGYFKNGDLMKMVLKLDGEGGKVREEYYLVDGKLFFVFTQNYLYNGNVFGAATKVQSVAENRYYFYNDKLFRWLDPQKQKVNKAFFKQKESELLDSFRDLVGEFFAGC